MTVRELRELLLKVECEGYEDAHVEICQYENHPGDCASELVSVLEMKWMTTNPTAENNKVVLLYE